MDIEDVGLTTLDSPRLNGAAPLFERDTFQQEFEFIFGQTVPSHNGCLSIEGGWGMGKTALLNSACLIAERSECLVLRARGGELEQRVHYGALLRLIEIIASLPDADDEISRHIELVGSLTGQRDAKSAGEIGAAFYSLLTSVRRRGPVLLAVDDADLVDNATMAALQYVFHRVDDQQIWLVVTSAPHAQGAGPRPIDHLLVNRHVRHFPLEPLSVEGIASIVSGFSDWSPDPEFIAAVHAASSGRPEFAVELVRACRTERIAPTAGTATELQRVAMPRISQRVLVRLGRLPRPSAEFLESCAVNGDSTDLTIACYLSEIDPGHGESIADAAARAEILLSGRPLTFVAPVIRWALLHDIAPARRSHLHLRCAEFVEEIGGSEIEVIEHLLATEPSENLELAARMRQAGRDLMEMDKVRLAAQCLRRSINESPLAKQESSLWLDLARCEIELGLRTSVSSFQKALTLASLDHGDVVQVAVKLMHALRDWPELRVEAMTTLRRLGASLDDVDPELQLQFELGLTILASHPAQRSSGVARIESLLEQYRSQSDAAAVARAFLDIHRFETDPTMSATTIVGLLSKVLDPDQMLIGDLSSEIVQSRACRLLLSADEFALVDRMLEVARRRARRLRDAHGEDDILRLLILSKLWQGSLEEAEDARLRHLELGSAFRARPMIGSGDLMIAQGRAQEALQHLTSLDLGALEEPLDRAAAHVERGRLFAACKQTDEALDEFHRASDTANRGGINNAVLVGWQPPAAEALATLGHWDEARQLAATHLTAAQAFGAPRSLGTALRAMAATTPDLEERITWLNLSVDVLEGSSARLDAAEAVIDLGSALVEHQDTESARNVLRRGATLASTCGAHHLVETAGSHLRAAGARPRRLGSTGVDSLTPAELKAVQMAAANVTNRAIADELFVNVKTIEGHLSRAYRKLGVTSRFELADALRGRDEVDEASTESGDGASLGHWNPTRW